MLVFTQKSAAQDLATYSAAKIVRVDFDIENGRVVIAVQYGVNDAGTFTPNKNVPIKRYVLDDARAATVLSSPLVTQMIDTMEKRLLSLALESGAQA